jgi:drug/metabolite transporter (DMT)-like permease
VALSAAIYPFQARRPFCEFRQLSRSDWLRLGFLGLVFYALTQGSQFLSLAYLPAAMVSLLLNLTPVVVGVAGIFFLSERPTALQWFGIGLATIGVGFYFLPIALPQAQVIGVHRPWGCAGQCWLLPARAGDQSQWDVIPIDGHLRQHGDRLLLLLVIGIVTQGFGVDVLAGLGIIVWLAMVNTAFAFTLWNQTLRTLTAVESSVINSLMMPQIAILAFVFLDEVLSKRNLGAYPGWCWRLDRATETQESSTIRNEYA